MTCQYNYRLRYTLNNIRKNCYYHPAPVNCYYTQSTGYMTFLYALVVKSGTMITGRKEMFYLTMHSTHFILRLYGLGHIVKDHSDNERGNLLRHMGYSFRLTARVLLYAPSHRQDSTYHGLCYTSHGALAGTRTMITFLRTKYNKM